MDEVSKIANRVLREYKLKRVHGNTDELLLDKIIDDHIERSGFLVEYKAMARKNVKGIAIKKMQTAG